MEIRKAWKGVPKPVRQVITLVVGGTLLVIGGLLVVLPGPFTLPFVFAGLSLFYFSPQVQYNGSLIDLATLNTEGQNLPGSTLEDYGFVSMAIPFGAGIKLKLSNRFSLLGEWGMRMTFTDYLDDVSYRYPNQAQMAMADGPSKKAGCGPLGIR